MRHCAVCLVLGLFSSEIVAARADDRDAALAVVERAIRAHGGEGPLARTRYLHRAGKGSWLLFGKENPFSLETTMQLPDRFRDLAEVEINGQKNRMTTVLNGDKAWQTLGAGATELDKDKVKELRDEAFVIWLMTLLPLRERALTLAPLPPTSVQGKPAAAVKVTGPNRPEATLFFDKDSGLLIKIERPAKQAGLLLKKEYLFTDHKDFEGVKFPTRWLELTNGQKSIEITFSGYDFPGRVDEKIFDKP